MPPAVRLRVTFSRIRMRPLFLVAVTLFASAALVFAHDPGLSSATITLGPEAVEARVTLNQRDLEATGLSNNEAAKDLLRLQADSTVLLLTSQTEEVDSAQNAAFYLRFAPVGSAAHLHIQSGIIDRLPFGHRQLISVQTIAGQNLGEHLLSAKENALDVDLANAMPAMSSSGGRFAEFFLLGVRHILTGYDHILFLAGILIVCAGFGATLRIITCFTIAHSITLALATFDVVAVPSRIVEPIIAASIVYVGIENLWTRGILRWREALTFAFGLVHGLGFASVLREMGIGTSSASVAVPLFSFNFGVEAGQLLVAACVLPLIWKLKSVEQFSRIAVPAVSAVIACAGSYWFFERIAL